VNASINQTGSKASKAGGSIRVYGWRRGDVRVEDPFNSRDLLLQKTLLSTPSRRFQGQTYRLIYVRDILCRLQNYENFETKLFYRKRTGEEYETKPIEYTNTIEVIDYGIETDMVKVIVMVFGGLEVRLRYGALHNFKIE